MNLAEHLQETDPTGLQTLERLAAATRFNRWMFETIRPYCKGHVFEVGSGIGNISRLFLEEGFQLTASDLRLEYIAYLKQQLGHHSNLKDVCSVDLVLPDFTQTYPQLIGQFDTVVALNVVEHIEDHQKALENCYQMLKPGGHAVILVPAFQALYNVFDEELGHFRRYTKKTLTAVEEKAGFKVIHKQYFNTTGMLGWFLNGRVRKKRLIPAGQLQAFDKLMPIVKLVDVVTFRIAGLSVIAVGRKP